LTLVEMRRRKSREKVWDAVVCGERDWHVMSSLPAWFRDLQARSRVRTEDESRFTFLSLNNHLNFVCNSC
jgi:hypothetical protein